MSGFRPLDPFQVYTDLTGKLAAGGNLHFYTAGTTTDADVYGDSALTVNNGPTIAIGTDGRAVDDVWGDGSLTYRCRAYAADGTLIKDVDNLAMPGAGGQVIPALDSSKFLTNDGTNLLWSAIQQALDPTGASNKIMGSDGTNLVWLDKPKDGAAGSNASVTVSGSGGIKIGSGTGDAGYIQWGTGSAPASGGGTTSVHTAFPTGFKSLAAVLVIPTVNPSGSGSLAVPTVTAKGTTGFDTSFSLDDASGNTSIINPVTFDWVAFGTVGA
jgi:hypothetical protein